VDESGDHAVPAACTVAPEGWWLGTVVPKRHARRAVTRSLLKRQMRSVMNERAAALPPGLWVLRLKAPFDPARFVSAASQALRAAARSELQQLLNDAAEPRASGRGGTRSSAAAGPDRRRRSRGGGRASDRRVVP
jgi:ribonuclease P protein component